MRILLLFLITLLYLSFESFAQNVGIGEAAPATKFEIKGNTGTDLLNVKDQNDDSKLYIENNGNVGIGTTSPTAKLQVNSVIRAYESGNFIEIGSVPYYNSTGTATGDAIHGKPNIHLNAEGQMSFNINADGGTNDLFLWHTGDEGSTSELMRLTQAGRLGIGETNPQRDLHVAGYGRFENNVEIYNGATGVVQFNESGTNYINSGNLAIGSTSPSATLDLTGDLEITKEGTIADFYHTTDGGHMLINFHSSVNSGSDKGFILFQDETANSPGSGDEDVRLSMGVHNDFRSSSSHSDELWFQGGGRLVYNVGSWDSELNSLIGTPGVGDTTGGHEFRVNNSPVMTLEHSGNLNMESNRITNITNPSGGQDAATKDYVDGQVSGNDEWSVSGSTLYPSNTGHNVSIGTSNAATEDLMVQGSIRASAGNTSGGGFVLADDGDIVDLNDGFATLRFSDGVKLTDANSGGSTVIQLGNGSSSTASERSVYFKTGQNFGIGTTSPNNKFHVVGSDGATSGLHNAGDSRIGGVFENTGGSRILIGTDNNAASVINFGDTDAWNAGELYYDHTSNELRFRVNNAQRAVIKSDGDFGIGTTNPDYPLHVNGKIMSGTTNSSGAYPAWIDYSNTYGIFAYDGNDNAFFGLKNRNGSGGGGNDFNTVIYYGDDVTDDLVFESQDMGDVMTLSGDGYLAVNGAPDNSYRLRVYGNIRSNGINETSDARLKKNVKSIESALDKVMALRGVNYEWRTEEFPDKEFKEGVELGVIAQEVEKVLPEVVDTDSEGYKSVQYSHIVPVLIEALKEVSTELENVKKQHQSELMTKDCKIEALDQNVNDMRAELDEIKTLLQISAQK